MRGTRAGAVAIGLTALLAGCTLSRPDYTSPPVHIGQEAFARTLEAHTQSTPVDGNRAQILQNGDEIFPAMLAAIREAKRTITFATFIYEEGDVGKELAEALADRCRAGVQVSVLVDAVGSSGMPRSHIWRLKAAGCEFAMFRSLSPFSIKRINHRNHRRILVVDGHVGFTGGIGVGEQWMGDGCQPDRWRQTDVRVEGPIVRFLQAAFAENWRDTTGVLLGGDGYFPEPRRSGDVVIQSVKSSPASGAAEAYLLFLLAIEGARESILLTNPYFVPDDEMADALARAAQRGVDVSVITAGATTGFLDRLVRRASQTHFPRAAKAGVKIYEYGPALLHAKTLVADGRWASIGSANLDNRSFALNNELNLVFLDQRIAQQLTYLFRKDLKHARRLEGDALKEGLGRLFYLPLLPLRDQL
jgi:cardiolipin synthase